MKRKTRWIRYIGGGGSLVSGIVEKGKKNKKLFDILLTHARTQARTRSRNWRCILCHLSCSLHALALSLDALVMLSPVVCARVSERFIYTGGSALWVDAQCATHFGTCV